MKLRKELPAEVPALQSQEGFLGTGGVRGRGSPSPPQQLTGVFISELNSSVIVPSTVPPCEGKQEAFDLV